MTTPIPLTAIDNVNLVALIDDAGDSLTVALDPDQIITRAGNNIITRGGDFLVARSNLTVSPVRLIAKADNTNLTAVKDG